MTINLQKIANPYAMFAVAWALCLALYSIGWSDLFPPITFKLFVFLAVLITLFMVLGGMFNKIPVTQPKALMRVNFKVILIVNFVLYCTNFLYSGIPLLKGIRMDDFGIPTVIVVATTLNCFTSVYCFYLFLISGSKVFLFYCFMCLGLFILVFSRGNIMMSLLTMFFLWINVKLPILNPVKVISIISGLLLVMFLFGIAGNYRTINDLSTQDNAFDNSYNSDVIMNIGQATTSFRTSVVPGEFFWSYLYLTSPLSNLQYNINIHSPDITFTGLGYLFIDELLFDTVSKRIDDLLGRKRADPDLIVEQLTVPTALAGSYNYAGWWGMVFYIAFLSVFPFIYTLLVLTNPLRVIGTATMCTIYFFSIFDNMFILTGLTMQLLFPIILNAFDRIKFEQTKLSSMQMQPPLL